MPPSSFLLSLAGSLVLALLCRACLCLPTRRRLSVWALTAAISLPLPLLIAPQYPLLRALAAIWCGTLTTKLYGLMRSPPTPGPSIPEFLLFLLSPFGMVYRGFVPHHRASAHPHALRVRIHLLRGVALASAGATLFALYHILDLPAHPPPFLVEHAIKIVAVFSFVWGVADILFAAWRRLDLPGQPMMRHFVLARTPAEFWRLYNCPVSTFFDRFVLRPITRRTNAVVATLVAFFISGVLHEYIATVALGQVQGLQMLFFMLHGVAVAATQRLRPRGPAAALAIALTLSFNILTSVLFIASPAQFIPWYDQPLPRELAPFIGNSVPVTAP